MATGTRVPDRFYPIKRRYVIGQNPIPIGYGGYGCGCILPIPVYPRVIFGYTIGYGLPVG
uniref:Uncharacterized protein n=1 Tax=Saccharum officinarum TaxID=4547 RepID=A0A678T6B6_SACOF|nr:hypothetical protein SO19D17_000002 [Saccharum officinarum]